jgi:hypothetical protein
MNFENKGNTHQTLCGGISTIALYVFVIIIAATRFSKYDDIFEFLSFVGGLMYICYVILN